MANTITQAIVQRFTDAGLTDFDASGKLWLDEIPTGKALPFICVQMAEETCEYTTERDYYEHGGCDFFLFAGTAVAAENYGLTVKAAFDVCTKTPSLLSISNAKVISWERTGYKIEIATLLDKTQQQVGLATFSYRYTVERILPS